MEENENPGIEREGDMIRIKKIPITDLLNILEGLYEAGTNFIDMEFFVDPEAIQSVITINTRPEYMATPEELEQEKELIEDVDYEEDDEEDEEEDEDIIERLQKENDEKPDSESSGLSDEEINELL